MQVIRRHYQVIVALLAGPVALFLTSNAALAVENFGR